MEASLNVESGLFRLPPFGNADLINKFSFTEPGSPVKLTNLSMTILARNKTSDSKLWMVCSLNMPNLWIKTNRMAMMIITLVVVVNLDQYRFMLGPV